jgi:hypothetical protein
MHIRTEWLHLRILTPSNLLPPIANRVWVVKATSTIGWLHLQDTSLVTINQAMRKTRKQMLTTHEYDS